MTAFLRTITHINENGLLGIGTASNIHAADGNDTEVRYVLTQIVRDDKVSRTIFDSDADYELAVDRFEELTRRLPSPENHAHELFRTFYGNVIERGEIDVPLDLLRDDFVAIDEREVVRGVFPKNLQRNNLLDVAAAAGTISWVFEPLAMRGDRLALSRFVSERGGSEFVVRFLQVSETDGIRAVRAQVFAEDDSENAVRLLDEWFRTSLDDGEQLAFDYLLNSTAYQRTGDRQAFLAQLAPDFAAVDRRVGGFGTVDREGWADRNVSFVDVTDGFTNDLVAIHQISEYGMLAEIRLGDTSGNEWRFLALGTALRGVGQRTEIFEVSELVQATERLRELTGALRSPSATDRPSNRSTQHTIEFYRRLADGGIASATELFADDWTGEGRHRLMQVSATVDDLDAMWQDVPTGDRWTVTPIAVRGQRLALVDVMARGDVEYSYLAVNEVDESGLARRGAMFDHADIDAALTLMTEWYLEGEGVRYRDILEPSLAIARAFEGPAAEMPAKLSELFDPDAKVVDMRPGMYPEMDTESVAEINFSTVTDGGKLRTIEYLDINDAGVLLRQEVMTHSERWGERTDQAISLAVFRHRRLSHMEFFTWDQASFARQRFEELTAGDQPATLRPLGNEAIRLVQETLDHVNGGAAPVTSQMAENFVNEDHRSVGVMSMDRDGMAALMAAARDEGAAVSLTPIATRGERLAAARYDLRWTGNDVAEASVLVTQLDDTGLYERMAFFDTDDLDAAIALLDEWYAASLGPEERKAFEQQLMGVEAQRHADRDALERLMPADFVAVDRRRGGALELDRAMWIDANANFATVSDGFVNRLTSIHVTERAALLEMQFTDADDHEWSFLAVSQLEDGVPRRIELFDPSDRPKADALYDKWNDPRPAESSATRPRAAIWLEEIGALYNANEIEPWAARLADGWVSHDERSMNRSIVDKAATVAWNAQLFSGAEELATSIHMAVELIASDDRHTIFRAEFVDPEQNALSWATPMVIVQRWTDAGLYAEEWLYTPEQLAEAETQYRQLVGNIGPRPESAAWLARAVALYNANEIEPWAANLADDWVSHDERPMHRMVVDKATTIVWRAAIFENADGLITGSIHMDTELLAASDRYTLYVAELSDTEAKRNGWSATRIILSRWNEDGLYAEEWMFEPEQRAEAESLYSELTSGDAPTAR